MKETGLQSVSFCAILTLKIPQPGAGRFALKIRRRQAACIQKEGAPLEGREEPAVRISVRNLVEFILRSGDLDNRRTAGAKKEAMLAGGRRPLSWA